MPEFSPAGFQGLVISREAWLAHIKRDTEMWVDHEDDHLIIASWRDRKGIFRYRHGIVTPESADQDALGKLGAIANTELGPAASRRRFSRKAPAGGQPRKVIPRAKAAALVAVAGLLVAGAGKLWLDYLYPETMSLTPPPVWLTFTARSLYMTGLAAVFVAWILAVSSLFPWERRSSLYAAAVFGAGIAVFLIV